MRIHVHDFSGHPFQFELSKALANIRTEVVHSYSKDIDTGQSSFNTNGLENCLQVKPITLNTKFPKYSWAKRIKYEVRFAFELNRVDKGFNSDAIILSNLPLLSAYVFTSLSKSKFTFIWHQDVYSMAINTQFRGKWGLFGRLLGSTATLLEKKLLAKATGIISISEKFNEIYKQWRIPMDKIIFVPNWASREDFYPLDNKSRKVDLYSNNEKRKKVIYAGTLGIKHNWELLRELELELNAFSNDFDLIILSSDESVSKIRSEVGSVRSIYAFPFQPIGDLPKIFSACDWAVAILEPNASIYSVPSKVMSYIACHIPVIGLMPFDNPASESILNCGGRVFFPNQSGARAAAQFIRDSNELFLKEARQKSREYALLHFNVEVKAKVILGHISKSRNTRFKGKS